MPGSCWHASGHASFPCTTRSCAASSVGHPGSGRNCTTPSPLMAARWRLSWTTFAVLRGSATTSRDFGCWTSASGCLIRTITALGAVAAPHPRLSEPGPLHCPPDQAAPQGRPGGEICPCGGCIDSWPSSRPRLPGSPAASAAPEVRTTSVLVSSLPAPQPVSKTWSQNLRACRSSRSTRPWLIVSVHVDAGFFPAAATGR